MDHHHRWSTVLATVVAVAMLIVATAAPALAADTRNVYVGTPVSDGGADGQLVWSPTSSGNLSAATVLIENSSQATMNKTVLTVGTAPADPLPDGVTLDGIYLDNGSACPGDASSATCSFGNLRSGAARTVIVVIRVEGVGTVALPDGFLTVKVKETVNDNGANLDTFKATGSVSVEATTCQSTATFVSPNKPGTVSTAAGCEGQSTTIAFPARITGSLARILEQDSTACQGNLSCFGQEAVVTVNDGDPIAITWTLQFPVSALPNGFNVKKAGVLHFEDDGDVVTIVNTKAGQCGSSPSKTDCIVSVELTDTTLTIILRTPSNGKVRGFG